MEIGAAFAAAKGEAQMPKMIFAAALVFAITSSSAVGGIILSHVAFARSSAINTGVLVDEAQSFRMVAKAPLAFDW